MLDPVLISASSTALAVLLASAASHKLRAPRLFSHTVRRYEVLPQALALPATLGLAALELALALGLLLPASRSLAALGAVLLMALYAAAIGLNLWRGRRDIDCGCSGPGASQPLRPVLLLRNLAFAVLALVAALPSSPRALGAADLLLIVAATAVALLIHVAVDGLLANQPRLAKLTGR
ncbi:methylamine utilization protein MauE [Pseudomonas entomophila]|uniref:MauE/DoxX family redox-associated membrane protein n=1 Tax=Pseudomonas entomophila TaxID=312306 RepID=UPI0023D854B3|nr:MauE/DoxX family redox-associated membrane protein [Pseudomonas entomophila]MDF0733114.1 methylamine utilization protein MauE [Pseudomonas entomophila]